MKRISSKISAVIIICSCIAVLVLGGISIIQSNQLVRSDARDKLQWMARQYAARFSNDLNIIESNVDEMEVYFRDTFDLLQLKADEGYLPEYEAQLSDYLFNFASKRSSGMAAWCYFNPEFSDTPHDVYYVDGNGDGIPERQEHIPFSYYDKTPTPTDDKQWWYGPIRTKDGFWTNPYEWTLADGEVIKVVSYAKPIFIEDEFVAVIGTYYHFDEMYHKITSIQVYESGYVSLYNEKLDVIIDPIYQSGTRYTSDNLSTVEGGVFAEAASEVMKSSHGFVTYELNGENHPMAYGKLSNGWVLGVNPVESEMLAGVNALTAQLLCAVAACMLLSVVTAYVVGKRMTRPLRAVVEGAERIGAGDFETYIQVATKDEVKTVADSLNEMQDNIISLQNNLKQLAYYDELTGIPNKNLFKLTAQKLILESEIQYAYVILDVNKFKMVNDIFGYTYGDLLLKHIAETVSGEFTGDETAGRFSGDMFHIMCHFSTSSQLETRLMALAAKIEELRFASDTDYRISVCFGIYVVESTNALIETMGDKASLAVEKIKNFYTTSIYFYNDDIRNKILEEQEIENDMQSALDHGEFKVYIQPKYSLKTRKAEGGEALVRWEHPSKGLIAPDAFVPLFEKNGFITALDMYMLEQVCKKQRAWAEMGLKLMPISVNQSRLHLHNPSYLANITRMIQSYEIDPKWIEFEITESAFFEDEEKMITILRELHELGFSISMDDFGSGYSSLNMLHEIEVDVLKIDKNFFNERSNSERGKKIVNNIISMASDLNIVVVAEGVETKEQVDFLMETECSLVQGYYFARPMPVDEFEKTLEKKRI